MTSLFATFEEFVAACPFTTATEAREYVAKNTQYDCFGLRKDGVERYGVRPHGTSQQMPVAPGSISADAPAPLAEPGRLVRTPVATDTTEKPGTVRALCREIYNELGGFGCTREAYIATCGTRGIIEATAKVRWYALNKECKG